MFSRFALVLVFLTVSPVYAAPPAQIAAAARTLAERPHAVEEVWREISAAPLPIVEPHARNAALSRVTFAIKTRPDTPEVRLDSVVAAPAAREPVADYVRDFTLPMQRIGESGIWWLSLDVPREVEAAYSFLVREADGWHRWSDPNNPRHLRGAAAEAVLRLDRAPDLSPVRPWPERRRIAPDSLALQSEALSRRVALQLHRTPGAGARSPLVVIYDAFLWGVRAPAWEIAANLAADGRVPPVNIVLVDQLDPESALRRYDDQVRFLADELIPFLRENGLSPGAQDIVLAGASRRGLAVARAALERPQAFGGVISLSGSFYWSPEGEAAEWLARTVPPAGGRTPRFHLAAGRLEYVETTTNGGHVMLDTNRRFRDALVAAGYDAGLHIFPGGHDIAGWRHALAEGLVALLGPEPKGDRSN
jgi:enterochelin esterase family protein